MEFRELVLKNRSYRRFDEAAALTQETLRQLVDLARTVPCGRNAQALRYRLVWEEEEREQVFSCLGWAKGLPDWPGPSRGERPGGYLIVLCPKEAAGKKGFDLGIACQTILLGAVERGLGGCMLTNIKREELMKALGLDKDVWSAEAVLALGKPKETVKLVPIPESGDTNYYRDDAGVHYVPKRSLDDLILPR